MVIAAAMVESEIVGVRTVLDKVENWKILEPNGNGIERRVPHRHILYVTDTSEATEATTLDLTQVELIKHKNIERAAPRRAHEAAQLPALETVPTPTPSAADPHYEAHASITEHQMNFRKGFLRNLP